MTTFPTTAPTGARRAAPATVAAPQHARRVTVATRIAAGCVAVGLLHVLDDALVHPQPGVPVGQRLPVLLTAVPAGVALISLFPRLRAGLQAAAALTAGVLVGTTGGMHVANVALGSGPTGSDATGVLAALAGLGLVAVAIALPFLRRGEGTRSRRRRWTNRLVATVAVGVAGLLVLPAFAMAVGQTHGIHERIGPAPGPGYGDVRFPAADGVELSGWYLPSRNRAAVLVVNSSGGDRNGSVRHARLLAGHGYGVLLYDARGSGRSEGASNGWGWDWDRDVVGALAFLRQQPDVDPDRIGALGLSTGADVLIEVAAEQRGLTAVVADGATGRSFADRPPGLVEAPAFGTMFAAGRLLSGTGPGRPLVELIADVGPTPFLLIAADVPSERFFNRRYDRAGGESVQLWEPAGVSHNAAIRQRPEEYEQRVIGLFDQTLLDRKPLGALP